MFKKVIIYSMRDMNVWLLHGNKDFFQAMSDGNLAGTRNKRREKNPTMKAGKVAEDWCYSSPETRMVVEGFVPMAISPWMGVSVCVGICVREWTGP